MATTFIVLFLPDGLPSLRKRHAELREYQSELRAKTLKNRELLEEVHRLETRDPELMEALARRRGFARPGETIYTFRESGVRH